MFASDASAIHSLVRHFVTKLGRVALCALVVSVLHAHAADAQKPPTVNAKEIILCRAKCAGETRSLVGKVYRYDDVGNTTSRSFTIQDDFETLIRVVTTMPVPERDSRVVVTGLVGIDQNNDPYINAQSIQPDEKAPPDADRDGVVDALDQCPGTPTGNNVKANGCAATDYTTLALVGLGAALVIVGIILALRGRTTERDTSGRGDTGFVGSQKEGQEKDLPTINFTVPEANASTLTLLPGHLVIHDGPDRGTKIPFVRPKESIAGEITFGRGDGPAFIHVRLKAPTVSRKHATIRQKDGEWVVTNYSDGNATSVNGDVIAGVGNSRNLRAGDLIRMGEITFAFHDAVV